MFGSYSWNSPIQAQPQTTNNGILWVQGLAGAKSYLVAPGQSVLLMDSEENVFYIKSCDPSGMPMPVRVFEYTERTAPEPKMQSDFVTREEFEKRLQELTNGKQPLSATE